MISEDDYFVRISLQDDPPPPEDDENKEKRTDDISTWDADFLKVFCFDFLVSAHFLKVLEEVILGK